METVGIVAEYDPFHLGHAWHMAETRRLLGGGAVVCVMSGHWVQRGGCAVTDKWTRAAAALMGGADLVLELPTPWAMASAEPFARGAVALLHATGVVDALSFGSEAGELAPLEGAAAAVCAMGLAGEIGWANMLPADGNATYRNRIIDAVYHMDGKTLDRGARYEIR